MTECKLNFGIPEVNSPQWLSQYARNVASQFGEDGIIEKALAIISQTDAWCVEFGAWDGKHFSNTFHLIDRKGYSAVLIESDPQKFRLLKQNYQSNPKVHCLCQLVRTEPPYHIDAILAPTQIPQHFDVLSIDINGCDFHVWQAMGYYRPKIIVIEYNPTIPNSIDFVQPNDFNLTQGCSLRALVRLARSKDYELIAVTTANGIFVDRKYFPNFGIDRNSPEDIRTDDSTITYLFTGYDGTVFLAGNRQMIWHNIPMTEKKSQQLPKVLRQFPDRYNWWKRILARFYFSIRK